MQVVTYHAAPWLQELDSTQILCYADVKGMETKGYFTFCFTF